MQRPAKPSTPVRFRPPPPETFSLPATVHHAASRHGIDSLRAKSDRLPTRLRGKSIEQISALLRRHYGDLLLAENIEAPTGNRAARRAASILDGVWIALDAVSEAELTPIKIVVQRHGCYTDLRIDTFRLRITAHTVARVLQRSLHTADIKVAGPVLAWHVAQAATLLDGDGLRPGDRVKTTSPEGELRWEARPDGSKLRLRGQTWIGNDE